MRINLNYVNAYLVDELIRAEVIVNVTANGYDIIQVQLASGAIIAIHLIERDIDLEEIKRILQRNARLRSCVRRRVSESAAAHG